MLMGVLIEVTHLEEVDDGGVYDHERSLDEMYDSVLDGDVGAHDVGEDDPAGVLRVSSNGV